MNLPHDISPQTYICRRCGETKANLLASQQIRGVCKDPLPHVRLCRGFYRMGYVVIQMTGGRRFVPAWRRGLSRKGMSRYGDWLPAFVPSGDVGRLAAYALRRELTGFPHAGGPLVQHIEDGGLSACGPLADLLEEAGWDRRELLIVLRSYR